MKRILKGRLAFAALLSILATAFATECNGQWGGSYGSSGGSSGISYGSSGGSSGYFRTPVRSYFRWVANRVRANRAYWGSYGSSGYARYGSSGGSSGYRRVYYRSASSGGSSGTTVYYYRGGSSGGSSGYVVPKAAEPKVEPQTEGQKASLLRNGYLTVSVPESTKIYVNDKLTKTTGSFRRYKTPGIGAGDSLSYQVKAVFEKDGEKLVQTKVVDLTMGDAKHLDFTFDSTPPPVTVLSLNVPSDADVTLAGNRTNATGPLRLFTTTNLKSGESWKDYKIVVSKKVDGKKVVQTKLVELKAGDSLDVSFDFPADSNQIASR